MTFRALAGHRHAVTLVSRAIARNRLPPSLIFSGPEGVGKHRAAMAAAAALNCLEPVSAPGLERDACDACRNCRRIARGIHTDVLVVEPGETGSIRVDQVREVVERAGYRPFEGRRRVVIVNEADLMMPDAQNALLKTLEEPPPASVFILVSSRADALLPTVRSRCPRLRFGRLQPSEIAGILMAEHRYTAADASAAAAVADGSVGLALARDSTALTAARRAAERILTDVPGADPRRRLERAQELAVKRPTPALEREALSQRLRALASMLRDVEVLGAEGADAWLANPDLKPTLARARAVFGPGATAEAFAAVDRAIRALERNASPKIVADWVVFQLQP
jgi:DNA polymerase-3 subunit delta'